MTDPTDRDIRRSVEGTMWRMGAWKGCLGYAIALCALIGGCIGCVAVGRAQHPLENDEPTVLAQQQPLPKPPQAELSEKAQLPAQAPSASQPTPSARQQAPQPAPHLQGMRTRQPQ